MKNRNFLLCGVCGTFYFALTLKKTTLDQHLDHKKSLEKNAKLWNTVAYGGAALFAILGASTGNPDYWLGAGTLGTAGVLTTWARKNAKKK